MSNKKIKCIVIIFIVVIVAVSSYVFIKNGKINNNNDNNMISTEIDNYKEFDKIIETNNLKECVVNNEEITNRDIILTEILNGEKMI